MKNVMLSLIAGLLILMLCLPALAIKSDPVKDVEKSPDNVGSGDVPIVKSDYFRVLDTATDKIENIPEWDYIWGVVAAEMGYTYHTEALKAQTIAAYTLAVRARSGATAKKEKYDISTDYSKHQAYMTAAAAQSKWGDKYEENQKKIKDAIEAVKGMVLTYDNEPIFAAYHAISGGKTETPKNVWGGDYPYLKPAESVGDLLADGYLTTVEYTPEAFVERAKALEITLKPENAKSFVTQPERSDSGTVTSYTLGGKKFTGTQIRNAFGLRSANFDLLMKENELVFTVRGYGHGVGMSQKGADYMAQQGSTYKEILNWYYSGTKLQKYEDLK